MFDDIFDKALLVSATVIVPVFRKAALNKLFSNEIRMFKQVRLFPFTGTYPNIF